MQIAYCPLLTADCLLPTAHCPLLNLHYQLLTATCQFLVRSLSAFCRLGVSRLSVRKLASSHLSDLSLMEKSETRQTVTTMYAQKKFPHHLGNSACHCADRYCDLGVSEKD